MSECAKTVKDESHPAPLSRETPKAHDACSQEKWERCFRARTCAMALASSKKAGKSSRNAPTKRPNTWCVRSPPSAPDSRSLASMVTTITDLEADLAVKDSRVG